MKLVIFLDILFANNYNLLSQIGSMITLVDSNNKANIIHWLSIKYKKITKGILTFELYPMIYGLNIGIMLKSTIKSVLAQFILIILCINLKSLYNCLVKLSTT